MDALYPYVKTLHILFAIIAVGFNASYAVWLVRGQRDPAHLAFAVKGVKFMDDYIANPCYLLLLLSGLAMAFVAGHWGFQRWIVAALILWVILMGLGYRVLQRGRNRRPIRRWTGAQTWSARRWS